MRHQDPTLSIPYDEQLQLELAPFLDRKSNAMNVIQIRFNEVCLGTLAVGYYADSFR